MVITVSILSIKISNVLQVQESEQIIFQFQFILVYLDQFPPKKSFITLTTGGMRGHTYLPTLPLLPRTLVAANSIVQQKKGYQVEKMGERRRERWFHA